MSFNTPETTPVSDQHRITMKGLPFLNRQRVTLQAPLTDYFSYVSVAPSNLMISSLKSPGFRPQSKGNHVRCNWYINIMQSVPGMTNRDVKPKLWHTSHFAGLWHFQIWFRIMAPNSNLCFSLWKFCYNLTCIMVPGAKGSIKGRRKMAKCDFSMTDVEGRALSFLRALMDPVVPLIRLRTAWRRAWACYWIKHNKGMCVFYAGEITCWGQFFSFQM